jgi:ankyrin repeat protein
MIEKRINPIVVSYGDTKYSLMHLAAGEGQLEIVEYISNKLYEKNPSTLAVNNGRTPLHNAAQFGHLNVTKFIVNQIRKEKQRKNPADAFGVTPAHLVAIYGYEPLETNLYMLKGLVNNVSVTNPAVIDDYKLGYREATVEHCAAASGQIGIVEYYNGEVTEIPQDSLNRTPLHYAVGGFTDPCLESTNGCDNNFEVNMIIPLRRLKVAILSFSDISQFT